jgi:hypothetical protein
MRLDPHYPPIFVFYQGLAQFAQDRFAEAAKKFEEITRLNPDAPWVGLYLAAAYGKDGRGKDSAASIATFSAARVRQGGMPFVMAELQRGNLARLRDKFPEKSRLVDGIRSAGVPYNFDSNVYDGQRLSGPEIDTLVFGHRLHGRTLETVEEHGASISADGVAQIFGDWGSDSGTARVDGNEFCIDSSSASRCIGLLRNPGGTRAKENEYIALGTGWTWTFSQVD